MGPRDRRLLPTRLRRHGSQSPPNDLTLTFCAIVLMTATFANGERRSFFVVELARVPTARFEPEAL